MSKERVLTTCWGKPSHVNRTTTASGSREQMVYGLCSAERHNASHGQYAHMFAMVTCDQSRCPTAW
jgi:hypothetical protein